MAGIVLAALVAAIMIAVGTRKWGMPGSTPSATSVRWAALVLTLLGLGLAPVLVPLDNPFWRHNPTWLTVVTLTLPIVLAGLPLLVTHHRARTPTTWICAILLTATAVLFGLGIGMLMLPGAVVLLLAAGLTRTDSRRDHPQSA